MHLSDDGGDDGRVTGNDQTSHGSGRTGASRGREMNDLFLEIINRLNISSVENKNLFPLYDIQQYVRKVLYLP